jgi:hypothetical protein
MERASPKTAQVRQYAERAYCKPFEKRGWVHDNGTLSVAAYRRLGGSQMCVTVAPGRPARKVPCQRLERSGSLILDCALLHLVPRGEVRKYIAKLQQQRQVRCDDDTPLAELGVP